jgi:hypothetical protein
MRCTVGLSAALLAFSQIVVANNFHEQVNSDNLTVHTRTGTFVGNLNDTYGDVRQFKYVPYAKVRTPPPRQDYSHQMVMSCLVATRRKGTLGFS